jgi:hypothetical protein
MIDDAQHDAGSNAKTTTNVMKTYLLAIEGKTATV